MGRRRANKHKTARALIEDLSHDGRGIARVEGKTVFVHGALPGEDVTFTTYRHKRQFDEATVDEVHTASPDRVVPRCEVFGICGGCALQHMDGEKQRDYKRQHLQEAFQHQAKVSPRHWLPDLFADAWKYRRRGRLGVKHVFGKGRVLVGFREKRSSYISDMHRCEILAEPVDAMLDPLSELIEKLSISNQVPQIEVAVGDNGTVLVFRHLSPFTQADLDHLSDFARERDVIIYLQPGGLKTVHPLNDQASLSYRLDQYDVNIDFEPLDFVQVNGSLNEKMISHVIANADIRAGDRVLDLFCGLGNFSLPLARCAELVVGVEGDESLVGRARANAAANGLDNVVFHVANLFEPEPQWPWIRGPYDVVLIDPPRAGAIEIIPLIAKLQPRVIAYVSCHPGTLARDTALITEEFPYRLEKAGIMDMFPHTSHVESVAIFYRKT